MVLLLWRVGVLLVARLMVGMHRIMVPLVPFYLFPLLAIVVLCDYSWLCIHNSCGNNCCYCGYWDEFLVVNHQRFPTWIINTSPQSQTYHCYPNQEEIDAFGDDVAIVPHQIAAAVVDSRILLFWTGDWFDTKCCVNHCHNKTNDVKKG